MGDHCRRRRGRHKLRGSNLNAFATQKNQGIPRLGYLQLITALFRKGPAVIFVQICTALWVTKELSLDGGQISDRRVVETFALSRKLEHQNDPAAAQTFLLLGV